jgi:very-short-patch-repair endonuclease
MEKIFNRTYLKEKRISLRKEMTPAEATLWNIVKFKQLDVKLRRQHGIGDYITDFYSSEIKLAIEIDGGIHDDIIHKSNDEKREIYLENLGINILRFNNQEVFDSIDRVKEEIVEKIGELKRK